MPIAEDMTGQFGFCGYFKEYDHDLSEDERLAFAPDERPPAYDAAEQPTPPDTEWSEERLAKANRNYAIEYIRNGVRELVAVLGADRALELGHLSARLTGLHHYKTMAAAIEIDEGGPESAANFLSALFQGMGDEARVEPLQNETGFSVHQTGLRIARGLDGEERDHLLSCWIEIWKGALASYREFMNVKVTHSNDGLTWLVTLE